MNRRKPTLRERGVIAPRSEVARQMLTSGHFKSRTVPNRKHVENKLACRRPGKD